MACLVNRLGWWLVLVAASCGGKIEQEAPGVDARVGGGAAVSSPEGGRIANAGGGPATGATGAGSASGGEPGGPGGGASAAGTPATGGRRDCGSLIDDMEDGSGRICDDGGRRGVWYTFNDESADQWPPPQTPGVPIPTDEISGGRGASRRAMHTYGGSFRVWGAGLGVDLAFDGTTYGTYDASAYDGITFWVRGDAGRAFEVRVSDEATTHEDYGGTCVQEPCVQSTRTVYYAGGFSQVWVPFATLNYSLDTSRLTNLQFFVRDNPPFDFWIDDLSFYAGEPACCADRPSECQPLVPLVDRNLAAALGNPTCSDTCDDTFLYITAATVAEPVATLSGLRCYASLVRLTATEQELTEVDDLAGLPLLSIVNLSDNQLVTIDGIAALTELEELDVSNNQLSSLAAVAGLTGTSILRAANNQLASAAGLESLSGLELLDLSNNRLATIAALPELPQLARLSLANNDLSDIEVLRTATRLVEVDLSGNQITDVSPLAGATEMTSLDLSGNQIQTVGALGSLTHLVELDLGNNRAFGIDALGALAELEVLDVSGNQLESIDAFSGLSMLTRVNLADNAVRDLRPLAHLEHLSSVDASNNAIEVLPSFDANLSSLALDNNDITDLSPLAGVQIGATLSLNDNPISDLGPLATLRSVQRLELCRTAITRLDPLVENEDLRERPGWYSTSVPVVDIRYNPQLDCELEADNITALRERGAVVETDCSVE